MDFGALPPEVTSAVMYAGPGAGSMLTAASAWSRLAAELGSAGRAYESVLAGLTGAGWLGPASDAMATAAAPYAAWLTATAGLAEQTAAQATTAASVFEEAHAAVVPPPVIAANRSELAALVATNVFGQHSAAIAALEAEYGQMWTQDAVAMYGYAGRAATAAAVTPFADPPATIRPGGLGDQAAAVAHAVDGGARNQLAQLVNALPQALTGLGSPPGLTGSLAAAPLQSITLPSATQTVSYVELIAKSIVPFNDAIKTILYGMVQFSRNLTTDLDFAAANAASAAGMPSHALASAGAGPVAAGIGNAATVGKVTVPATWVQAAPAIKAAMAAVPAAGPGAAAAAPPGGIFTDMALAGLAGRAIAGSAPRGGPVSVASVMNGHAQGRLERLVTELAGTHEVQHWHVDPSRLDSLLEELSEQPGVHAVHVNNDGRPEQKLPPQSGPA